MKKLVETCFYDRRNKHYWLIIDFVMHAVSADYVVFSSLPSACISACSSKGHEMCYETERPMAKGVGTVVAVERVVERVVAMVAVKIVKLPQIAPPPLAVKPLAVENVMQHGHGLSHASPIDSTCDVISKTSFARHCCFDETRHCDFDDCIPRCWSDCYSSLSATSNLTVKLTWEAIFFFYSCDVSSGHCYWCGDCW